MDADVVTLPSNLRWLLDFVGLGGVVTAGGLLWRASGEVRGVKKDIENLQSFRLEQLAANAASAARVEDLARQHGALAISVAALPTRDEMRDMLDDISAQILGARSPPTPRRPKK